LRDDLREYGVLGPDFGTGRYQPAIAAARAGPPREPGWGRARRCSLGPRLGSAAGRAGVKPLSETPVASLPLTGAAVSLRRPPLAGVLGWSGWPAEPGVVRLRNAVTDRDNRSIAYARMLNS